MFEALRWTLVVVGTFFAGGTFLSLSSHPHWFVRGWDFPRPQLVVLLGGVAAVYVAGFGVATWWEIVFLVLVGAALAYNARWVAPYTPWARHQVEGVASPDPDRTIRLLTCNVLKENRSADRLLDAIDEVDPDVVFLVETDSWWQEQMESLVRSGDYPYVVQRPQENHYGMCLYSRLELLEPMVLALVEDDVPSIHARIRLPGGETVAFHGVHPRPPEPVRDQDSVPRDAELAILARLVDLDRDPAIVAGDLNDVAWSATTSLFLRLSKMVDPRVGRGFYNTWDANSRVLRLALDHIFHTGDFELVELRTLDHVGSDHFPVVAELCYRPGARAEDPEQDSTDVAYARESLRRAGLDTESTLPARVRLALPAAGASAANQP